MIQYERDGTARLSYVTTGGNLDVVFFMNGGARDIIQQYHQFIGRPAKVPYWSLGWHFSGNFGSLDELKAAVDDHMAGGFPMDVVHLGKNYTEAFGSFTVDSVAFKGLQGYINQLKETTSTRIVPYVDSGISVDKNASKWSKYYREALAKNATLIEHMTGEPFIGKSWTDAFFLDFFANSAKPVWSSGLLDLNESLPFDGVFLDRNEPTVDRNYSCELRDDAPWFMSFTN